MATLTFVIIQNIQNMRECNSLVLGILNINLYSHLPKLCILKNNARPSCGLDADIFLYNSNI